MRIGWVRHTAAVIVAFTVLVVVPTAHAEDQPPPADADSDATAAPPGPSPEQAPGQVPGQEAGRAPRQEAGQEAGQAFEQATVTERGWAVPRRAWITMPGHGYGHGRGMSQYGAFGAAREGLGYAAILRFYYPRTSWGTAGGAIRVLVTADTSRDVIVLARAGLKVRDLGTGETVTLPDNGADRWRLEVDEAGRTVVDYRIDTWTRWRTLEGDGEFTAGSGTLTLVTPVGNRDYRGRLRAASPGPDSSERDTVNVVSLEGYLKGVVPLEVPASWPSAAVRAQAVAARTYAAFERAARPSARYHLCDTTSCQVYGGFTAEHPSANDAVAATARRVRVYDAAPAFTQFSASNGGWTVKGSMPYLPAKQDSYDGVSANPYHDWTVRVTDGAIERRWPAIGNLTRIRVNSRDGNGEWGGRIGSLTLSGGRGSVTMTGDDFRYRMGLRSHWLTFRVSARD